MWCPCLFEYCCVQLRANWYFLFLHMQQESTQLNGIVWLTYDSGSKGVDLKAIHYIIDRIGAGLPHRVVSSHHLYQTPEDMFYLSGFRFHMKGNERFKIREHLGSLQELNFKLMTYGLPMEHGPMQLDGTRSVEFHHAYLANLRNKENLEAGTTMTGGPAMPPSSSLGILIPSKADILLGRSSQARSQAGNQRLSHLVAEHFQDYSTANKQRKTSLSDHVVGLIHESGGRFLKEDPDLGWIEVEDLAAREKVSHAFRHYRHKSKKKKKATATLPAEKRVSDSLRSDSDDTSSVDDLSIPSRSKIPRAGE